LSALTLWDKVEESLRLDSLVIPHSASA
jgi:hypothetical protein